MLKSPVKFVNKNGCRLRTFPKLIVLEYEVTAPQAYTSNGFVPSKHLFKLKCGDRRGDRLSFVCCFGCNTEKGKILF